MVKKILFVVSMFVGFCIAEEQQIKTRYKFNTSHFSNILGANETNIGNFIFNFNDKEIIMYHNNYISVSNVTDVQHNISFLQFDGCTSFMTNNKYFKKFYICNDNAFDVGEAGFTHYYNSK